MNKRMTALTLAILIILISVPSFICGWICASIHNESNMIQTTTVMVNSNNVEMKININTASREELKTLQGVGEYKADLIILNRSYSNIYDLLDRDIIGEDLFNSIKDKITI